jgi:hypothetical protein
LEKTATPSTLPSNNQPKFYKILKILFPILIIISLLLVTSLVILLFYIRDLKNDLANKELSCNNTNDEEDECEYKDTCEECESCDKDECDCPETDCPDLNCMTEFSNEELLMMEDWKKFENEIFGYSFRYPKDWELTDEVSNVGIKEDTLSSLLINFYSGEAASREILYPTVVENESDIEIGCVTAHKKDLKGDASVDPTYESYRFVVITFENSGTSYRVEIVYEYLGASITGDIIDMYTLILKTFRFE